MTASKRKAMSTTCSDVVSRLKAMRNPANAAGMARYGISAENALGLSMPVLRKLARDIG